MTTAIERLLLVDAIELADKEDDMHESLHGTTVLIVGGASGIGRRIAADAIAAGAQVVLGGRDRDALASTANALGPAASAVRIDLGDEQTIRDAAEMIGGLDHVVSPAAAHANGRVIDLERDAVVRAFDAKVIGPLMLAKHFGPNIRPGGSMLLFSGVAAWRPAAGLSRRPPTALSPFSPKPSPSSLHRSE